MSKVAAMATSTAPRSRQNGERAGARSASVATDLGGIRFSAYLGALSAEIRKARSGERTRLRLMSSGANLLENIGFRELQVEDICRDANMAKGTFYIYFKSKEDFLQELGRTYVQFELGTAPIIPVNVTRFAHIRTLVDWHERTYALNVGVIRCIVQMAEISAEMRDLWHRRNAAIVDRVVNDLLSRGAFPSKDPRLVRLAFRVAASMADQSVFDRYHIHVGTGVEDNDDVELVKELNTLLIYRALFGEDPPTEELSLTLPLLG